MKSDSRLSGVLHLLLHMADSGEPMTSDTLAAIMRTNPVVVRRTLAGLRRSALVRSERGHGGGWTLAADLERITLRDVHAALGAPPLFAIGNRHDAPDCLLEQAVNAAIDRPLRQAEDMLLAAFSAVSLATLRTDTARRLTSRRLETPGEAS